MYIRIRENTVKKYAINKIPLLFLKVYLINSAPIVLWAGAWYRNRGVLSGDNKVDIAYPVIILYPY